MKCSRCGHAVGPVKKDGWRDCPNCGLSRYVGPVKKVKKKKKKKKKKKSKVVEIKE